MHCKTHLSELLQFLQLLIIIVRIFPIVLQYELRKGKKKLAELQVSVCIGWRYSCCSD